MSLSKKFRLKKELKSVTSELASLNVELAEQMILLASQTGDCAPLISAVNALRQAQEIYSSDTVPHKHAQVQKALGDTLLTLGRANDDIDALDACVQAYRSAITLASMLGDEEMRMESKLNYAVARRLLESRVGTLDMRGAA